MAGALESAVGVGSAATAATFLDEIFFAAVFLAAAFFAAGLAGFSAASGCGSVFSSVFLLIRKVGDGKLDVSGREIVG